MRGNIFFIAAMVFSNLIMFGQKFTSEGTEFYFSFIQNRIDINGAVTNCQHSEVKCAFYIANNNDENVFAEIDFSGADINYYLDGVLITTPTGDNTYMAYIYPNQLITIEAVSKSTVTYYDDCINSNVTTPDPRDLHLTNNGEIQSKVYSVKSSSLPIVVFAESYQTMSRDVSMILPVEALGNQYFAFSYTPAPLEYPYQMTVNNTGGPSEIGIVAVEDNTEVFFRLPSWTDAGDVAWSNVDTTNQTGINGGVIHSVLLNEGEAYQIQSDNFDLTGTNVWSGKRIAVFSGNMGVDIEGTTRDYIYEQVFPVKSAEMKYIITQLINDEPDIVKVMGLFSGTELMIDGEIVDTIGAGEVYSFFYSSDNPIIIEADKGINIAQYGESSTYTGIHHKKDPFLLMIGSINLLVADITFMVPKEITDFGSCDDNDKADYLHIISPSSNRNNIYIDNFINPETPVSSFSEIIIPWTYVPVDTDYSYCVLNVSNSSNSNPKNYRLFSTNPNEGFNAIVYGLDCVEGYGYTLGINISEDSTIYVEQKQEDQKLIIFPNPNDGSVFVESPFIIQEINLYGLKGELLVKRKFDGNKIESIQFEGLSEGTYIIEVKGDGQTRRETIIKH